MHLVRSRPPASPRVLYFVCRWVLERRRRRLRRRRRPAALTRARRMRRSRSFCRCACVCASKRRMNKIDLSEHFSLSVFFLSFFSRAAYIGMHACAASLFSARRSVYLWLCLLTRGAFDSELESEKMEVFFVSGEIRVFFYVEWWWKAFLIVLNLKYAMMSCRRRIIELWWWKSFFFGFRYILSWFNFEL